jgi:transcriptional regulator with XRE-family HTH domain
MHDMALTKSPAIVNRLATTGLMKRLPDLMKKAGVDKAELISMTGINQPTIYALHGGYYESSLSGDSMLAIADALGVTLSELTGF